MENFYQKVLKAVHMLDKTENTEKLYNQTQNCTEATYNIYCTAAIPPGKVLT